MIAFQRYSVYNQLPFCFLISCFDQNSRVLSFTNLILEHSTTEGPDCSEHKVEFIQLFVAVRRRVGGIQKALQKVTQSCYHGDIRDRRDLLEAHAQCVQTDRHVLVKQDLQVGFLGLHFAGVNPAWYVSNRKTNLVQCRYSLKVRQDDRTGAFALTRRECSKCQPRCLWQKHFDPHQLDWHTQFSCVLNHFYTIFAMISAK